MARVRYRLGQGLRALFAPTLRPDASVAKPILSDCEFAAFCAMSRADQWHSLRVLDSVFRECPSPEIVLCRAALLHDVGKSRHPLAVWQKTLAVLVKAAAPGWSRDLGMDEALTLLRAPFVARAHHPRWGGEILRECGADDEVIWLVENHQKDANAFRGHPLHAQLVALRRADNIS